MCKQDLRKEVPRIFGSIFPESLFLGTPCPWADCLSRLVTRCLQDISALNMQALKLLKLTLPPIPMSEDCLFLNIYTPDHAHEGSKLPVSVESCSFWGKRAFLLGKD